MPLEGGVWWLKLVTAYLPWNKIGNNVPLMGQWRKTFATMLDVLNLIPGLMWQKEGTDSHTLSSDMHMHAMACTP